MPDASEELITTQSEIANGTRQAQPSGRLPSLLVGRPRRNGSGSASGPGLGGSSGRGIGVVAPGPWPGCRPLCGAIGPCWRLQGPERKLTCRQIGSYTRAQELLREGHT
jgi:hypothetical protein